jgi:hypothetical protein
MFATVSTKKFKASLLKTAMAGSLHCWREPLEIKKNKESERAREQREGGGWARRAQA